MNKEPGAKKYATNLLTQVLCADNQEQQFSSMLHVA